ncbi:MULTISPECIES: hypothetical protein [unclassified Halorhabdus]|uniref:hypothetical protein n=1 Tax=unclassified Halorhabdus TaxID=2621901 RepID=UPI0023D9D603|nr:MULTISPECIES: hypothetical protein [unclassified Halorhabdus]WEL17767.1 Uncharacterized protein SVXHr_1600 [Halorhabdus sp. SVX81]WEL21643.1 Uncharacterized protein HBNXHr_1582 [Halorhabdus sp. BNX81]
MPEYPVIVREIGGQNRLGVEEADDLEADVREIVTEGYEQINVERRDDGEVVGTVVASDDRQRIEDVHWDA